MAEDVVIEKIRKLLRLANNSGATEGEAAAAMKAARMMMEKYGIEEAAVTLAKPDEELLKEVVFGTAVERGKVYKDEMFMAHVVCAVCDVRHFRQLMAERQVLVFYGLPRSVAIARALFVELMATVRRMARENYGPTWCKTHNDYVLGIIVTLYTRATEMKRARQAGATPTDKTCTALMRKTDSVLDKMEEHLGIKTKKASQPSHVGMSEYMNGASDGQHISLGVNQVKANVKPYSVQLPG